MIWYLNHCGVLECHYAADRFSLFIMIQVTAQCSDRAPVCYSGTRGGDAVRKHREGFWPQLHLVLSRRTDRVARQHCHGGTSNGCRRKISRFCTSNSSSSSNCNYKNLFVIIMMVIMIHKVITMYMIMILIKITVILI